MLNNQKSPSCKIVLRFDSDKTSTSATKTMSFVGSSAKKGMDGSTLPGSVVLFKDIWQSLLITHQGNSQVKDNKIDLIQQYEYFTILEEESIDSGFARFNTINTSLKALDEGFSSKNYVRKFLRALHPKWREKVTVIKESKDLSSLALDELISNQ
uniref:UBN2 domain-containing protein n=1 Tax=Tanacetum cinerariifolium TaxID=118510 RepID=A0A699L8X8_TANCI|nr:UBN2 domain-containing protein [Tanacetum cinerariifolium]